MKLKRPHVPISVRVEVVERMSLLHGIALDRYGTMSDRLRRGLRFLFQDSPVQLDHDPALCNRKYFPRTDRYEPPANDPRYLIYRTKEDHDTKTRLRGEGAQLSDLALRRKFKRIEKRTRQGKRRKT